MYIVSCQETIFYPRLIHTNTAADELITLIINLLYIHRIR
jgi:hypothetical protein